MLTRYILHFHIYGLTQEGRCRTPILRIATHLPCRLLNVVFTYLFVDCMTGLKGELQYKNKLISYKRAFKMLENDTYITVIRQAVLELLSFKVRSGNHQIGISLLQKFSEIFGNMRLISPKMTSYLTSHNFQILKIWIFSKPCKI